MKAIEKLIAKYNHTWNINGRLSSGISYSQVIDDLEKLKEEMNQEQIQEKENQSLEEFINSQPYYGHCTPEYLEGIEVGAKWQEEQSKEMEKEQRGYTESDMRSYASYILNNPVIEPSQWYKIYRTKSE